MFDKFINQMKESYREGFESVAGNKDDYFLSYIDRKFLKEMRKSVNQHLQENEQVIYDTVIIERGGSIHLVFTNHRIIFRAYNGVFNKRYAISYYSYGSFVNFNIYEGKTHTTFRFNIMNNHHPMPAKIKVYKECSYQVHKYMNMEEPPLF